MIATVVFKNHRIIELFRLEKTSLNIKSKMKASRKHQTHDVK